jgi:hypothetical protein
MTNNSQLEVVAAPATIEATPMELVARSEIDSQIATAKRYPRSIKRFMDSALQMATLNEGVASSCIYGLPRGGKIIEGASSRFAEIILNAWGNAKVAARVISQTNKFVEVQGMCHDLETNTAISVVVTQRIADKYGKTYNDDMIVVAINAAISKAIRNATLKVVPQAYWHPVFEEARKVTMGDSKTLASRRALCIETMQKFGVTADMILKKFELKGLEDLTLEHLTALRAVTLSIKDGDTTVEEVFPSEVKKDVAAKGNEGLKAALAKGQKLSSETLDKTLLLIEETFAEEFETPTSELLKNGEKE